MKKKIVITGGLGYIGTELCKLYSGVSWHHKIIVIDNRFISERVNQIRNWNMEFIQGDILDKDLIKKYCADADIVHHLAGVTDVPRVKSESSPDQENYIQKVAEEGTQNILDVISDTCKIIMPSTHVVYEGLESIKKDIRQALDEDSYIENDALDKLQLVSSSKKKFTKVNSDNVISIISQLEKEMYNHAKNLEFEQAAKIRDQINELQEKYLMFPKAKS